MQNEDKAVTVIPESPSQVLIKKVDRRDKIVRSFEMIILLSLVVFVAFSAVRLQQIVDNNQRETVNARQANVDRQNELKDYIKCILLLRYDASPEALNTRVGAEAALNACAVKK